MKDGFYDNISNFDYHNSAEFLEYLSRSDFKHLLRSPAHFKAYKEKDKKITPALAVGQAYHNIILNHEIETVKVTDIGGRKSKAFIALQDDEALKGNTLITEDEQKQIEKMKKVLMSYSNVTKYLKNGIAEQAVLCTDKEDELLKYKIKIDYQVKGKKNYIVDLKTTNDASYDGFQRAVVDLDYAYDIQTALYTKVMEVMTGEKWYFLFIAQEKELPYAVKPWLASEEVIQLGEMKLNKAIGNYRKAITNNHWFAYNTKTEYINPPHWAGLPRIDNIT